MKPVHRFFEIVGAGTGVTGRSLHAGCKYGIPS